MPHFTSVPLLETGRLKLRAHRPDDLAACAAMWADPIVTHHIGGKPFTEQESWSKILRYAGLWALMGFGYWAVEEMATGHFIGELGFADFKRDLTPSIHGVPELGWVLAPSAHGKGYATEALLSAVAWGDLHLGVARTACLIGPENAASLRVSEKCGYQEFKRTTYMGKPQILFTREANRNNFQANVLRS
jgi:RimJ/RimL family protein N-acetyltransferase